MTGLILCKHSEGSLTLGCRVYKEMSKTSKDVLSHTGLMGRKKDANGSSENGQAFRAAFHQLSEHQSNTGNR